MDMNAWNRNYNAAPSPPPVTTATGHSLPPYTGGSEQNYPIIPSSYADLQGLVRSIPGTIPLPTLPPVQSILRLQSYPSPPMSHQMNLSTDPSNYMMQTPSSIQIHEPRGEISTATMMASNRDPFYNPSPIFQPQTVQEEQRHIPEEGQNIYTKFRNELRPLHRKDRGSEGSTTMVASAPPYSMLVPSHAQTQIAFQTHTPHLSQPTVPAHSSSSSSVIRFADATGGVTPVPVGSPLATSRGKKKRLTIVKEKPEPEHPVPIIELSDEESRRGRRAEGPASPNINQAVTAYPVHESIGARSRSELFSNATASAYIPEFVHFPSFPNFSTIPVSSPPNTLPQSVGQQRAPSRSNFDQLTDLSLLTEVACTVQQRDSNNMPRCKTARKVAGDRSQGRGLGRGRGAVILSQEEVANLHLQTHQKQQTQDPPPPRGRGSRGRPRGTRGRGRGGGRGARSSRSEPVDVSTFKSSTSTTPSSSYVSSQHSVRQNPLNSLIGSCQESLQRIENLGTPETIVVKKKRAYKSRARNSPDITALGALDLIGKPDSEKETESPKTLSSTSSTPQKKQISTHRVSCETSPTTTTATFSSKQLVCALVSPKLKVKCALKPSPNAGPVSFSDILVAPKYPAQILNVGQPPSLDSEQPVSQAPTPEVKLDKDIPSETTATESHEPTIPDAPSASSPAPQTHSQNQMGVEAETEPDGVIKLEIVETPVFPPPIQTATLPYDKVQAMDIQTSHTEQQPDDRKPEVLKEIDAQIDDNEPESDENGEDENVPLKARVWKKARPRSSTSRGAKRTSRQVSSDTGSESEVTRRATRSTTALHTSPRNQDKAKPRYRASSSDSENYSSAKGEMKFETQPLFKEVLTDQVVEPEQVGDNQGVEDEARPKTPQTLINPKRAPIKGVVIPRRKIQVGLSKGRPRKRDTGKSSQNGDAHLNGSLSPLHLPTYAFQAPKLTYRRPAYNSEDKERLYADRCFVMDLTEVEKKPDNMFIYQIMKPEGYLLQYCPAKYGGRQYHISSVSRWYFTQEQFSSDDFYDRFQPIAVVKIKEKKVFPETRIMKPMVDTTVHFLYADKSSFNRFVKQVGRIHKFEYLRERFMLAFRALTVLVVYPEIGEHILHKDIVRLTPDEQKFYNTLWQDKEYVREEIMKVFKDAAINSKYNPEIICHVTAFPDMKYTTKNWKRGTHCSACPQKRAPIVQVTFTPTDSDLVPYNDVTLQPTPEKFAPKPEKEFYYFCHDCSLAVRKMHRLYHYMQGLYRVTTYNMAQDAMRFKKYSHGMQVTDRMVLWAQSLEYNWICDQFLELQVCLAEVHSEFPPLPAPVYVLGSQNEEQEHHAGAGEERMEDIEMKTIS